MSGRKIMKINSLIIFLKENVFGFCLFLILSAFEP